MALNIKDSEADNLARELAALTGESLTEAVLKALRERLSRQRQRRPTPASASQILSDVQARLGRIPVQDPRTPDEILGYDERGLPRHGD